MKRAITLCGAAVFLLSACASEPQVVTKVVVEPFTVDRSLFVTQPFPPYPPRPVTLAGMVQAFEQGKALYLVCQARLREIQRLIEPLPEEPPCNDGRTDCR